MSMIPEMQHKHLGGLWLIHRLFCFRTVVLTSRNYGGFETFTFSLPQHITNPAPNPTKTKEVLFSISPPALAIL